MTFNAAPPYLPQKIYLDASTSSSGVDYERSEMLLSSRDEPGVASASVCVSIRGVDG